MKVLITGGAGFIGSTIASACLDEGIEPVILDNLSTGRPEFTVGRTLYRGDIADGDLIDRVFHDHPDIHAVINCAARIVVPESVADPLGYYDANVTKGLALVSHLLRNGCHRLVFSGSAAIYDSGQAITEDAPLRPLSPYARTKSAFEGALEDITGGTALRVITLRYFNPIGADPKLRTGLQTTKPTHALGVMIDRYRAGEPFPVTGTDWPTRDGSGIRDYVHVWDLAAAHIAAVRRFDTVVGDDGPRYLPINLGSGNGTTVFELIKAFEDVTGEPLAHHRTEARPGDNAGAYPAIDRAHALLGWTPGHTLQEGIAAALEWNATRHTILKDE
ncbi:UDP-glucose 4-epimerase GalE [Streptomyces sp. CBMA123]|uniref:UDP-glucose 4-epimerase GalE n=1 Tax=Streptomyces sp. CBMA123 TaxID=1896313 RepID=UPI001661CD1F|nr:UDP-glucose 4-epimerase GalE [Streptomyces sp. CBMA123]MBD0692979.1 UDP-glucose 4-epimerase GalE [Streptomyces sp. CBMA123]